MFTANLFPKGQLQPDLPPDVCQPRAARRGRSWFKNPEERQRIEMAEALIARAKQQVEAQREAYAHHLTLKVNLQRREMKLREEEERVQDEQAQARLAELLEARRRQRQEISRSYYHPREPAPGPPKPQTAEDTRGIDRLVWLDDDSDAGRDAATPVFRPAGPPAPEPGTVAWLHQNLLQGGVLRPPPRRNSSPMASTLHTPLSGSPVTPSLSAGLRSFADGPRRASPHKQPRPAMQPVTPKAPISTLSQFLGGEGRQMEAKGKAEPEPLPVPPEVDSEPPGLVSDMSPPPAGDATFLTGLAASGEPVPPPPAFGSRRAAQWAGRHGRLAALPAGGRPPAPQVAPKSLAADGGLDQALLQERLAEFERMQWYAVKVVQYADRTRRWRDPDPRS